MSSQLWVVRAGREAAHVDEWRRDGVVAINFVGFEAGDLTAVGEAGLLGKVTGPAERTYASQLISFAFKVEVGDLVVVPQLPKRRTYLVGEITSGYTHVSPYPPSGPHRRAVRWLGEFDRDALSPEGVNTLGAIQTIFRPTKVEAELRNLLTDLRPWTGAAAPTSPGAGADRRGDSPVATPPAAQSDQVPPAAFAAPVSRPAEVPLRSMFVSAAAGGRRSRATTPRWSCSRSRGTSTRRATGGTSPGCTS